MVDKLEGTCLCGAIKVRVEDLQGKSTMICRCDNCRKCAGSSKSDRIRSIPKLAAVPLMFSLFFNLYGMISMVRSSYQIVGWWTVV
jgi:hypothetical protein